MNDNLQKIKGFPGSRFWRRSSSTPKAIGVSPKFTTGFTLVEIMVATSIFMVIMLVALGSLITSSDTAKKAQALRTAMDNVNFALESMTRSLRMGSDYYCVASGSSVSLPVPAGIYNDCPLSGSGGGAVVFTPADNPPGSHPPGARDTAYTVVQRSDGTGTFVLRRCVSTVSPCVEDMVSSNVNIEKLIFYVNGSDPTDNIQPSIYILVKGSVSVKGVPYPFNIQTIASQRSSE